MKRTVLISVILSISLLCVSCLQTSDPDTPKRISFLYRVDQMGENIVVNQDSIAVEEIKFLVDRFNMVLPDSVVLQTSVDALAFTYRSQFQGEDENVLSANIGYEDFDRFRGLQMFVKPPMDDDNIQDNDFFGNPANFSFVVNGTYNNEAFEYKSGPTFDRYFRFDDIIELDNENETLLVRVVLSAEEIFVDQTANTLLDPNQPENQAKIDSLLKTHISIEAFSANLF